MHPPFHFSQYTQENTISQYINPIYFDGLSIEGKFVYYLMFFQIKAAGAQMLGGSIGNITNIVGLDISDNNLELEIPSLLAWIQVCYSLVYYLYLIIKITGL